MADVAAQIDTKLAMEDVQAAMEDRVTKNDLQYAMSNKVSVEEMSRILENKSNTHQVNASLQAIDQKIEDIYSEMMKKVQSCALQRDFNYMSAQLEKKANLDEVNESLQGKANKTSVATALQRKANKSDLDSALDNKADVTDMEQICTILEGKLDSAVFDDISNKMYRIDDKVDRVEFNRIADQLVMKANREDVD